jgi:hypothetical protein
MPSIVWGRDPQEAFENPYEYEIQAQFVREAKQLLDEIYKLISIPKETYTVEDCSVEKAIWLLQMDALSSLRDCLKALTRKEHRIAGKLFRDIVETCDLAAYFNSRTKCSMRRLEQWYDDSIITNNDYRNYIKSRDGEYKAKQLAKYYQSLSKFTHRTYRIILDGYSKGSGNRLVHDGIAETHSGRQSSSKTLVLPQTIATYMTVLADLIIMYFNELFECRLIDVKNAEHLFTRLMNRKTIPRKYTPSKWLIERLQNG